MMIVSDLPLRDTLVEERVSLCQMVTDYRRKERVCFSKIASAAGKYDVHLLQ